MRVTTSVGTNPDPFFLPRPVLGELIDLLRQQGYTVVGPSVEDAAVSLRPIESAEQLPKGVRDQHSRMVARIA
jgi:hypothetical protein